MNERQHRLRVRRILLALDASTTDVSMLAEAVRLAARFQAELLGLFVEDDDLFRMVGASSVRGVDALMATPHDLDSREVERLLRAQAARVRRSLDDLAERLEVPITFRVTRGQVTSEVLREAEKADVLVLGRSGWALVKSRRLSPTARAVLSASSVPTLVLQRGTRVAGPPVLIYDGSLLAEAALSAAITLAERDDGRLVVLILGDGMEQAIRLRMQVKQNLRDRPVRARYHLLTKANVPNIVSVVRTSGRGTIVLPAKSTILHADALLQLLDQVDVPVLLVR